MENIYDVKMAVGPVGFRLGYPRCGMRFLRSGLGGSRA